MDRITSFSFGPNKVIAYVSQIPIILAYLYLMKRGDKDTSISIGYAIATLNSILTIYFYRYSIGYLFDGHFSLMEISIFDLQNLFSVLSIGLLLVLLIAGYEKDTYKKAFNSDNYIVWITIPVVSFSGEILMAIILIWYSSYRYITCC